jgi:hypothetical protein
LVNRENNPEVDLVLGDRRGVEPDLHLGPDDLLAAWQ